MSATEPRGDSTGAQLHPQIEKVAAALAERESTGAVRVLPDSARTAAQAAAALGCEVGAIANSLLFDAAGAPLLVMTSGAHRVDTPSWPRTWTSRASGGPTPDFVRRHTGQAIGGVSPVGHPSPVRTLVDRWLARYDVIWAAGRTSACGVPDDLRRAAGADRRRTRRRRIGLIEARSPAAL